MFGLFKDLRKLLEGVSEQQRQQARAVAALQLQLEDVRQETNRLAQTLEGAEERVRTRLQRVEEAQAAELKNMTGVIDRAIADATQDATRRHEATVQEIRERLSALQSGLAELANASGQAFDKAATLHDISDQIMPMNSQFFHLVSEIRARVDEIGRDMDNLIASNMAAAGKAIPRPGKGRRKDKPADGEPGASDGPPIRPENS